MVRQPFRRADGRRARRPGHSAQSLTEFALILPVLALIVLGVVDFGRVFYYWTSIANGAREGARYGVVHATAITNTCRADPNNVKYRVKQEAGTTLSLTDADITVSWVDATTGALTDGSANCNPLPGDRRIYQNPNSIRVEIGYDFKAITPMIANLWGGGPLRIRSSAQMVIE
ncbi:MAG TPA: TadE/TadG family type IV pilus assembly protein [Candidatus Limnocylindrales bacterium]|nr:TadE/TadG family type IV pilus assembly protein [Candidatus Limnocylindrales bacterium]